MCLRLVVFVIDGVSVGQHAPMQDSRNQNPAALLPIENDVLSMLMTSQARANVITGSAHYGIVRKDLAASLKLAEVLGGLVAPPFL